MEQTMTPAPESGLRNKLVMPGPIEQLRAAWQMFINNWQTLALLALIPMIFSLIGAIIAFAFKWIAYVPSKDLAAMVSVKGNYIFNVLGFSFVATNTITSNIILSVLVLAVAFIVMFLVSLFCAVGQIVVLKHDNEKIDVMAAIKGSVPYIGNYFIFSILYTLLLMVGFIFLIVPGVLFLIWFSFGYLSIIIDDRGSIDSFRYSKQLVKNHWWAVMGRLLFWFLVALVIGAVLALIKLITQSDYVAILSDLVALVVGPLGYAYYIKVYQDMKLIKNN